MLILELEQVVHRVGVQNLIRPLRLFSARAIDVPGTDVQLVTEGPDFHVPLLFLLLVSLCTAPPVLMYVGRLSLFRFTASFFFIDTLL